MTFITLINPPIWHCRNTTDTQLPKDFQEKLKTVTLVFRQGCISTEFQPSSEVHTQPVYSLSEAPSRARRRNNHSKGWFSPSLSGTCSKIHVLLQTAILYPSPAPFNVPQVCQVYAPISNVLSHRDCSGPEMVPVNKHLVSCSASRRCYCGRVRVAVVHPCLSPSITDPSCLWIYLVPVDCADASCLLGQQNPEVPSYSWYEEVFYFACFQLMYSLHRVTLMLAVWDQGIKSPRAW